MDPFDDPDIAAEMQQVVGRRYVCFGCGWSGNAGPCPKCGGKLIDRWQEFADEARAAA